jgi:hypothetical protein
MILNWRLRNKGGANGCMKREQKGLFFAQEDGKPN